MYRLVAALLLVMAGSTTASSAQDLPYGPTLTFAVYRNGDQIGRHVLTFQHDGSNLNVSTSVDFNVKMMGFTAYRYTHRAQETWKGESFQTIASQTDDNGKKFTVRARTTPAGLDVVRNAEHEVMPPGLLPSSHWNVRQIAQSNLLNTQNGTQARVQITPLGREKVKTANGWIDATHYRYSGDVAKDQWFDDRGRWVKTTFKASDGSAIEYILQE